MRRVKAKRIKCWGTDNRFNPFLCKVNNGKTITMFQICSNITIKTPERRRYLCFGVLVVNFE